MLANVFQFAIENLYILLFLQLCFRLGDWNRLGLRSEQVSIVLLSPTLLSLASQAEVVASFLLLLLLVAVEESGLVCEAAFRL